jgi:hypothetical protein
MRTVAINVLKPSAFNAESQYFIPLFNQISWLCGQHPRGDEASSAGCNSGPTGHAFPDNSNIYLIFFTMRIGPFSKCENRSGSQIDCQVRTWAVLTRRSHLQWEPPIRFSWQLTFSVLTVRFLLRTGMKTGVGFSANGWEPPNTGLDF